MKVTLDLDKLLAEGKINREEHDRLLAHSARSTGELAFNILVGFGVLAVAGATLALVPTPGTAVALGLLVSVAGLVLIRAQLDHWKLLANLCLLVGALLFGGGVIVAARASVAAFLLVAGVFTLAGTLARSNLLIVLAVIALSGSLGAWTGYAHAAYFLGIRQPGLTIILFTILAMLTWMLSRSVPLAYRGIALAAARTAVFLVNFGFWIGSLWGDRGLIGGVVIPDWLFAVLWALATVAAAIWAWRRNRRWLVNVAAVFAGINFYTQWFERLTATPGTVLVAGLLALAFAFVLKRLNASMKGNT